jgi:hypothetical protein
MNGVRRCFSGYRSAHEWTQLPQASTARAGHGIAPLPVAPVAIDVEHREVPGDVAEVVRVTHADIEARRRGGSKPWCEGMRLAPLRRGFYFGGSRV